MVAWNLISVFSLSPLEIKTYVMAWSAANVPYGAYYGEAQIEYPYAVNVENNYARTADFFVVTPTPTQYPSPTPTRTPTPAAAQKDLAAWQIYLAEYPGIGEYLGLIDNTTRIRIYGAVKNVGTTAFDVGGIGLQYTFKRKNLLNGSVSTIGNAYEPGPSESPGLWPVGRIGGLYEPPSTYLTSISAWEPGYYIFGVSHNASQTDPQLYSDLDTNSDNNEIWSRPYWVKMTPTPTPTLTPTMTPTMQYMGVFFKTDGKLWGVTRTGQYLAP